MKTAIDNSGRQSELPDCCGRSSDISPDGKLSNLDTSPRSGDQITLSIAGMTCVSCVAKVQSALQKIGGVHDAKVRLADATARVQYDARQTSPNEMISALESIGYEAEEGAADKSLNGTLESAGRIKGPMLLGATAALAVIIFYLGLITLTSDWSNAVYQFSQYGGWVIALAAGLSLQVGLFARMRSMMAGRPANVSGKGIAASGSMSGVAMALCCSHYLATILPAIGLPFLSGAVAGLAEYQTAFFVVGVISNILGLAYMLRLMAKNGMIGLKIAYR